MIGMIFCGFLLVLAFWGVLNSRRQNIKLAPQPMASRVMSLYNMMRRDMFQCYFVAFIAQLPAVVCDFHRPIARHPLNFLVGRVRPPC